MRCETADVGQRDAGTKVILTHILDRTPVGVPSPLDRLR